MAEAFSLKFEGVKDLEAKVKALSPKGQRRVWRNALRSSGQKTVQKDARANLKAMGLAKDAKDVTTRSTASAAKIEAKVGAKLKAGRIKRLGHIWEKGTRPHAIRAKRKKALAASPEGPVFGTVVDHPGAKAKPWLLPALEKNRQTVAEVLAKRIDIEIAKARAKGF